MMKKLLTSTAFVFAAICSPALSESYIRQDVNFCERNTGSVICAEHVSGYVADTVTPVTGSRTDPYLADVTRMNSRVVSRFRPQKEDVDVWNVFTNLIDTANRNSIVADCEDVAMTAIEYMTARGIPANRFARAIVLAYPQANIGDLETTEVHLVGVYFSVETNRLYYIGDSYKSNIDSVRGSLHEPMHINWLTDGLHWIRWSFY